MRTKDAVDERVVPLCQHVPACASKDMVPVHDCGQTELRHHTHHYIIIISLSIRLPVNVFQNYESKTARGTVVAYVIACRSTISHQSSTTT
jgi:hypothetical protein